MANIAIRDLQPAGADLFSDSESYMRDLSDTELALEGGVSPIATASSATCVHAVAWSVAIASAAVAAGAAAVIDWIFD